MVADLDHAVVDVKFPAHRTLAYGKGGYVCSNFGNNHKFDGVNDEIRQGWYGNKDRPDWGGE